MPKVTAEHRLARRAQIVAAARTLVAEQGFHKTTMADLIEVSGLSAGAVYGYFKSKEEIVAAIAEEALGTVENLFDDFVDPQQPMSPIDALERLLQHVVSLAERPGGDVTRIALQAWAEALHNPAVMAIAGAKYTDIRGRFELVARRAQAAGILDPDADPRHIAQVLFGLLPGFVLQRLILGDTTPETYTAGLRAVLRG
ncbi:TetR/AcrR family transcriptional regulator [Kribbella sandramycini]|uniref:AcrR family transcriptional regulator n=1 Tax=Kribbella sandramycini TaxID=60450 RepID=A0A7Y4L347_9ACTN|nr:TetR/AcrR family transcriptional regulator [Kribbella sandramycini]MBB6571127.1 AcrR family transcriptional regulator [Kribbella sandramycini]NOL43465.1 TetR/AcrR family transcriptional regulator [Kribbella sandramycini]